MGGKSVEADTEDGEAKKYRRPMNGLIAVGKRFL